jgi:hypothetical protein
MADKLREWYRALATASHGVLFEDASIMVGVQAQYQGPAGRMMLHFRNRASVSWVLLGFGFGLRWSWSWPWR